MTSKEKTARRETERSPKTYHEIAERPKELTLHRVYKCKRKKNKKKMKYYACT